MAGIQIEIAVAAFGIAPDGPLRHGRPKERDRTGGNLALLHAGFGDLFVHFFIQPEGDQFVFQGQEAIEARFQPPPPG